MSLTLKRFIKGSDCNFVCVATFPKHSADKRQQILWGCLVKQGATVSWLLAHTTMYCGEGGDHMAYPSAQRFMLNRGRKLPLMIAHSWSSTRLWHSHTSVARRRKASKRIPRYTHCISTSRLSVRTPAFYLIWSRSRTESSGNNLQKFHFYGSGRVN